MDEITAGAGDDMSLATCDLPTCVITSNTAAFGRFDTLTIDYASTWACFASLCHMNVLRQMVVDLLPHGIIAPAVKVSRTVEKGGKPAATSVPKNSGGKPPCSSYSIAWMIRLIGHLRERPAR